VEALTVRRNLERVRAEIGDGPDILAAVKYVDREHIGALVEAGITVMGENRAQELIAKAGDHPDVRWHFIGRLQSRKVKQILPHVELIHSVESDSVLRELGKHGTPQTPVLVEVNVAREEGKAGVDPDELGDFIARCPARVVGLMTMPPATEDPEGSRPHFARLRELAAEHGLEQLSMGTSQDYRVAVEEGATIVRLGSVLYW
jgi:PLP dependent protein